MIILYAEDDFIIPEETDWKYIDLQDILKERYPKSKFRISITRDGTSTHNILRTKKFNRIILDIMMPLGNNPPKILENTPQYEVGFKLLEYLLSNYFELNSNTKIDILTGTAVFDVMNNIEDLVHRHRERVKLHYKPVYLEDIVRGW